MGLALGDIEKLFRDHGHIAYSGEGVHINSGFMDGMGKGEAIAAATAFLEADGLGEGKVNFRLRDCRKKRKRE